MSERAEQETTSRIDRQELLGLLDSTRLGEQRVTAEIEVPALDQLLESEVPSMRTPAPGETAIAVHDDADAVPTTALLGSQSNFVIVFRSGGTAVPDVKQGLSTLHVVLASFAATLAIGFAFVLAL